MKGSFYIQWHITNRCNLRCQHCYQEDFSKNNDLDWPGLKKISDHLLRTIQEWHQTTCIHLTGGEPLLKPELFTLLNELDQQSVVEELGIITNGLFLDEKVLEGFSTLSKLKKIKISLDGGDSETNDFIRSKGVYHKVLEKISMIQKKEGYEIILMFTALKRNFRSLPSLFQLGQALGVDGVIIERFIPLGQGKRLMGEILRKEDWRELIRMLKGFFRIEGNDLLFLPYQAFQVSFKMGEVELLGAPCVIGMDGICVMPEGDVFPCRRFPISIGNLLDQPLKEIWENSELLKTLKKKENLKGQCGSCEIKECRGCRSLTFALTHDYLEEDPYCGYSSIRIGKEAGNG